MFKFISVAEQLVNERKKNRQLDRQADKNAADIEYLAMMSGIDLLDDEDGEAEDEQI